MLGGGVQLEMSSSVFFKFKSQKEPSRVTFDGTGISVFELKRAIIETNNLGDGTDFDLAIYNEDTNEGMSLGKNLPLSLRTCAALRLRKLTDSRI